MCSHKPTVTRDEIHFARAAPLYDFLVTKHMELFRRSGSSLYMIKHDAVYIKQGFPGFNDFSSGMHGNPVDFLMNYLGYSFVDAVRSLNDFKPGVPMISELMNSIPDKNVSGQPSVMPLPSAAQRPYRNMYAYLMRRGIPLQLIKGLEKQELIYQEDKTNNIVFISKEKDYCELRGTFTYTEHPYHGCRKSGPDRFWYMSGSILKPRTAYICEAAIDAISLYIMHKNQGQAEASLYVSIGGVANQKAILRAKQMFPVVLAVDNDRAGDDCRRRNQDLPFILPVHKDWNEDLMKQSST